MSSRSMSRALCCGHQSAAVAARLRRNAKPQRVPGGVEAPAASGNRHTWLSWWSAADNADALHTLAAMPWADVHAVEPSSERTALHRAVRRHDAASVRLLLSLGLAVDAVDVHLQTPLLMLLSASQPCMQCMSLLLLAGADAQAADERCVPITYCARHGSLAALQLLLQHSQEATALLETPDPEGRTALYWAATEGQLACLDALLLAGACVNAPSVMGVTPLRAAVSRGGADRHAVVTRLLEAGALVHGAQRGAANSWGAPSARAHRNLIDVALCVHGDAQLAELLATHAARQGAHGGGGQ